MRRGLIGLILLMLGALSCGAAAAQDLASLVADRLTIRSGSVLEAAGHVEIFYQGRHLQAERLTYDSRTDRLEVQGPIWIDDGKGNLLTAELADLSADLTEGILQSARLVLANRLQLAAGTVLRTGGGRYTALKGVAASSCTVCPGNPVPLWEIRAREVVHDAEAQQIWFTGAQLRFAGVPVLYLPELRVPDPNLKRATGFLLPSLRTTTRLGTGLKFPYFITLGSSRDLTVTPYLTFQGDKTVSLRYRQAFRSGNITISGALSDDGLLGPAARGYLQAEGSFDLPRGFRLSFDGITVSDPAYLLDYGLSDDDRLKSTLDLTRVERNGWVSAQLAGIQSLRAGEANGTFPSILGDVTLQRRFEPAILGGTAGFTLQAHTTRRGSTDPGDANGDGIADGRDLSRLSARADWRRNWLLPQGIELATQARLLADAYGISQDATYGGGLLRAAGTAGVELRWPWMRAGAKVTQSVEPVLQLVASPPATAQPPNEDSTLVEFDEGNLFSFDRFPGADAVESGVRANLGVTYSAWFADGLALGATLGRVLRLDAPQGFPDASGLDGQMSDWLLAWNLSDGTERGLQLTSRLVVADDLTLTKGEVRLDLVRPHYDLAAGYGFVSKDVQEARPTDISEITFDAGVDLSEGWRSTMNGTYNLPAAALSTAGVGLTFANECLNLDLSLSRRFTASTSVKPSTDFGLSVELLGFGGTGLPGMSRQCR